MPGRRSFYPDSRSVLLLSNLCRRNTSARNQERCRRLWACLNPPFWLGRMQGSLLRTRPPAAVPPAGLKAFFSCRTPPTGVPFSLTCPDGCSKQTETPPFRPLSRGHLPHTGYHEATWVTMACLFHV